MTFRILLVISGIFLALGASGQLRLRDTTKTTHRNRFMPTGMRVGVDAVSIIKDRRQENFSGWEASADVETHRYLVAADYGKWGRIFSTDSVSYRNDGTYWRAGVDANFLTHDPERNVFFIGFRYARARYDESMSMTVEDPLWGFVEREYVNSDMSARWFELTTGLKVKVWKLIWLGYTARFKFGLKDQEEFEMLSHDIPGYGNTNKETYWGFNYLLMIRIPLGPTRAILPAKK